MAFPRSRKGLLVSVISTFLLTSLQSSVTFLHQVWSIPSNCVITNQTINTIVMTCQYFTLGVDHTLKMKVIIYVKVGFDDHFHSHRHEKGKVSIAIQC